MDRVRLVSERLADRVKDATESETTLPYLFCLRNFTLIQAVAIAGYGPVF